MRRHVPLILAAAAALFSAAVYARLPERFAVHWSLNGVPNGYADRWWGAFAIPVIMLILPRIPLGLSRGAAAGDGDAAVFRLMADLVLAFLLVVHVCVLGVALGWAVPLLSVVLVGAGVLTAATGAAMRRVGPNRLIGIRTRRTLSSPRVWEQTHRVAGVLFIAAGAITVAAAVLAPRLAIYVTLVSGAVAAFGSLAWSFSVPRDEG
jgi:uncharacterized membrane protein